MNSLQKYNQHLQTYFHLENEVEGIIYTIKIDDSQLNVKSLKIADIILWASAEIETLCKELYRVYINDKDTNYLKFDYNCLDKIIDKLNMSERIAKVENIFIDLSLSNCVIKPFKKAKLFDDSGKEREVFDWNDAYQNLKHGKGDAVNKYGTIKYLLNTMSALYLLNIYFYYENYKRKDIEQTINVEEPDLKSKIFNVCIYHDNSYKKVINYPSERGFKKFEECVYVRLNTDGIMHKQIEAYKQCGGDLEKLTRLYGEDVIVNGKIIRGPVSYDSLSCPYILQDFRIYLNRGKMDAERKRSIPIEW